MYFVICCVYFLSVLIPEAGCSAVVLCNETILSDEANPYCSLGASRVSWWKLVTKIDGSKSTFHYDSGLWSNMATFNPLGGETIFNTQETKLETYWNTSFSKICLGMKTHGQENTNFVGINKTADSLYSLIADGQYRATSLGLDAWKTLIGPEASLQLGCYNEGFNVVSFPYKSKARIGILGNVTKTTATPVIPESGLVQEGILLIVETRLCGSQIMAKSISEPWDTYLYIKTRF